MEMKAVLTRIERRLKKLGLTAAAASRAATGSPDTIRNWQRSAKAGKPSGASTTTLLPLAVVLKTTQAWLVDGEGDEEGHSNDPSASLREVVVAAYVQAGAWTETWEWPDEDKYHVAVPADPEMDRVKLYAAETKGPSMNRRWPEGTIVIFSNAIETGESPIVGKRYVVERRRASGEEEHTVKLLHQDDAGRYWLVPESHDPLHQTPIPLLDGAVDGDEVRIVGRVRFAVSRE